MHNIAFCNLLTKVLQNCINVLFCVKNLGEVNENFLFENCYTLHVTLVDCGCGLLTLSCAVARCLRPGPESLFVRIYFRSIFVTRDRRAHGIHHCIGWTPTFSLHRLVQRITGRSSIHTTQIWSARL